MMTAVLKGYKRKMNERIGVPCFKLETHRAKLTFSRVLWCISAMGLAKNFYTQVEITHLVPCFIRVIHLYVTGHGFSSIFFA